MGAVNHLQPLPENLRVLHNILALAFFWAEISDFGPRIGWSNFPNLEVIVNLVFLREVFF